MIEIRPREIVILADDFDLLVGWYRDVLGFADPEGNLVWVVDNDCP